jgi:hypothetical protein
MAVQRTAIGVASTMMAVCVPAKVPTAATKPSCPRRTNAGSVWCISQKNGSAPTKPSAVAASSTGLRPKRSPIQPIPTMTGSSANMLRLLMPRARAGAMPSTSWSQLTT